MKQHEADMCCMCVACVLHVCCTCVAFVLHVCCICVACHGAGADQEA